MLQYLQAAIEGAYLLGFATGEAFSKSQTKQSSGSLYAFIGLINVIAWIISGKFLQYEYRKRLSEGLITHQMFWVLTLLVDLTIGILRFKLYVYINS